MPELPEVETVRRMLETHIAGKQVTAVKVITPQSIIAGHLEQLVGLRFTEIGRIGKYLICRTDGAVHLYAHLGMSGMFYWSGNLKTEPDHVRAIIHFAEGMLYFRDVRRLKGLWITNNETFVWKQLGPDVLSDIFTPYHLTKVLCGRNKAVKLILLDQALMAGIGNIYAAEILFRAGISPLRSGKSLRKQEVVRLYGSIRNVMEAAVEMGGTTLRDYHLSDGRDAEFNRMLNVYGHEGEHCPRCGEIIIRIVQGARSSFYCPNKSCQH